METKKIPQKNLQPMITQMSTKTMGMGLSTYLANDIYYFIRFIQIVTASVGEDWMRKYYPNYYLEIKPKIFKWSKKALEVKAWYDRIEDKKMEKGKEELTTKRFWRKTLSKFPLITQDLWNVVVFLIVHTQLHRIVIPNEAFKILEHTGFKKITMGQKSVSNVS